MFEFMFTCFQLKRYFKILLDPATPFPCIPADSVLAHSYHYLWSRNLNDPESFIVIVNHHYQFCKKQLLLRLYFVKSSQCKFESMIQHRPHSSIYRTLTWLENINWFVIIALFCRFLSSVSRATFCPRSVVTKITIKMRTQFIKKILPLHHVHIYHSHVYSISSLLQ